MRDEKGDRRGSSLVRRTPRSRPSPKPTPRGEFDFIERIRQQTVNRLAALKESSSHIHLISSLVAGIGDDAAVIRNPRADYDTVVTADLLVEGVDFRLSTTTPRLLGHKALAVSLSDIAAMGARPRWALLSVGAPRKLWGGGFLEDFYEGFFALADAHGVALVGGDVSRTSRGSGAGTSGDGPVVIDSIVLGEVGRGRAVLRSGARPGDKIFVTGTLGGAAAGLRLLEGGARVPKHSAITLTKNRPKADKEAGAKSSASDAQRRRRLVLRQLSPEPRSGWGMLLGQKRLAASMIDLSDGLSSDLAHLCRESGVGARIDAERVPVDPSIGRALKLPPDAALALALSGGEDFELLFAARPRAASRLPEHVEGVAAAFIGVVTDEPGRIVLARGGREETLEPGGFRHF